MAFFIVYDCVTNQVLNNWDLEKSVDLEWLQAPAARNLVDWEVNDISQSARFASKGLALEAVGSLSQGFKEHGNEINFLVLQISTRMSEQCEEIVPVETRWG